MRKKQGSKRCKHEKIRELLPNLYECDECGKIIPKTKAFGLYISDDLIPEISVITKIQAGIIAAKTPSPGRFINLEEVELTQENFTKKILELSSLDKDQKIEVRKSLKEYGFDS